MDSRKINTPFTPIFLKGIPKNPGVYLMISRTGKVLYVGKARDLRKRLSSYSRHLGDLHLKTGKMLSIVHKIDTILTNTEKEALILEASLIKKFRPKYNVILRDDKNYPYIKVTLNEEWPRLIMTRRRKKDGARCFGPFSSSAAMWKTISYLNTLFPLRRCKEKNLRVKTRPCLNFQMDRCLAPCVGMADHQQYMEMVHNITMALEGRNQQVVKKLKLKMDRASRDLNFEEAAMLRDRIVAIQKTMEKQIVVTSHFLDQDVISLIRHDSLVAVSFVFVREGIVNGKHAYFLDDPIGGDAQILSAVIEGYYSDDRPLPHEVILPLTPGNKELYEEWLSELKGSRVVVKVPIRGDRKNLLEMAKNNAKQLLFERTSKIADLQKILMALKDDLHLRKLPLKIECLDIANLGGEMAVGSLVAYENGSKSKSGFRHYTIQSVAGQDDYAMMAEVLRRRFSKVVDQNELPDMLLLDGGKGQLHIGMNVLAESGLENSIDIVSIAKERADEGEKIYRPGRKNPITFAKNSAALHLLMRIRDEAHRFGITFHRKLRKKKTLHSLLDEIPGIGPTRKRNLLSRLGSLKKIKDAEIETLSQVEGIGPELAETVWHFLKGKQ